MVKKFIQLERLAYLLLTKEQKILFDNLPRPQLTSNITTSYEGQKELIPKAIQGIINKEELDLVDLKLLEVYESNI
jgi:hypothetical protein